MSSKSSNTVVGVFSDPENARKAIRALRAMGIEENQIGVASSGQEGLQTARDDGDDDSYAGEGAVAGAAAGAGIGALWGLGILAGFLPAIGPAIAGGTLASILASAATGAAAAGLGGALIGLGMSKEEAEYYESELKSGRTIVTVQAGNRRNEVTALLRQHGAYNMENRTTENSYQTSSCSTSPSSAAGAACDTGRTTCEDKSIYAKGSAAGQTVQAHEEKLRVDKQSVEKGNVKVRKEVHTEHKTVDVPVTREEIVIERHAGNQQRVSADQLASGQEIRIPVREDQVRVSKENVVAEEVSVGKRKVQSTQRVDEDLRKEEIKVETQGDVKVRDNRNK